MKIELGKYNEYVYNVMFEKITLYMSNYACLFLSKPTGKNHELKFNSETNNMILKKFNVCCWDTYKGNYLHLKFLATYSPILSKFIDPSEFDNIKIVKSGSNRKNESLIKFKHKNFYSVNNVYYAGKNIVTSEKNNVFNEI